MNLAALTSPHEPSSWLQRHNRWLIIFPPFIFLLVFFLIPFGFALMISFSQTAIHVPPYTSIVSITPDSRIDLSLHLGNYKYLSMAQTNEQLLASIDKWFAEKSKGGAGAGSFD